MEEEFYSVLKLTSGEELISKVSPCDEGDRMILMLNQPIVIKNIFTSKLGVRAYSVEPWIKLVDDDIFFIDMNAVITMTEVSDFEIITVDRVAQPSAPGAYPTPVYEHLMNNRGGYRALQVAKEVKEDPKAQKYLQESLMQIIKGLK